MGNSATKSTAKSVETGPSSVRGYTPRSLTKKRSKTRGRQIEADFYENLNVTVHQVPSGYDRDPPQKILDLCLIMDCTGSMSSWMAHCKDTLKQVIDDTIKQDPTAKVRVSFVGYRDFCDEDMFAIHDFSYDIDAVKAFMGKESARGGGDTPEDVQGGLRHALDLNWSAKDDSVKIAFLCADAPAHGSKYHTTSDDYPQGNPCGLNLEDLMKEFSDREILLTCYKITNETEKMYPIMKTAYDLGSEEGGMEFIDLREEVNSARSRGVSLHAEEVRHAYAAKSCEYRSMQVSKQRCRKTGW